MTQRVSVFWIFSALLSIRQVQAVDFTNLVFAQHTDGIPAAFGDFNSDELTDVFLLKDEFRTIQVYLGAETEPLLRPGPKCTFQNLEITSVVPGDFDGDAFMDILMTVKLSKGVHEHDLGVYVNWGGGGDSLLNCTNEHEEPLLVVTGEPLALDYNDDMIIDLFGMDKDQKRSFWLFNKTRTRPDVIQPPNFQLDFPLPHSHAFLDINGDFTADLVVKGADSFEIWNGTERQVGFVHDSNIPFPSHVEHMGQSLFVDADLRGTLNHLLPVCYDSRCQNSSVLIYNGATFDNLRLNFKDSDGQQWGFVVPHSRDKFTNTITLRGGDYNMDGYPDFLVTLNKLNEGGHIQTFLVENVPCGPTVACAAGLSRTFSVQWNALLPFSKNTVMGAFYDFYQDGILDVIMVEVTEDNKYRTVAFRNALDYDANFVKVIVLAGLLNSQSPAKRTALGRQKKTYGTNLPGPRVAYHTTTQGGDPQFGTSAQIPQSAYFALQLPYTVFGLGRTPNFVDTITVGLCNRSRTWTQLIPNSQMIVIPYPIKEPNLWTAQLFVTPSKLIVMSTLALGGTCLAIMGIILVLYIKEKREDKLEKLQESHRFHFDAM